MVTAAALIAAGFSQQSARDFGARFGGIAVEVRLDDPAAVAGSHGKLTVTVGHATRADFAAFVYALDVAGFGEMTDQLHAIAADWRPPEPFTLDNGRFQLSSNDVRVIEITF